MKGPPPTAAGDGVRAAANHRAGRTQPCSPRRPELPGAKRGEMAPLRGERANRARNRTNGAWRPAMKDAGNDKPGTRAGFGKVAPPVRTARDRDRSAQAARQAFWADLKSSPFLPLFCLEQAAIFCCGVSGAEAAAGWPDRQAFCAVL